MERIQFILEKYSSKIKIISISLFVLLLSLFFIGRKEKHNQEEGLEEITIDELLIGPEEKEELFTNQEENEKNGQLEPSNDVKILVDLKGAVVSPGVYEMDNNDRVIDCIQKGGGFLEDAEETAVNLAQRIKDEMVIYIPVKGEESINIEAVNFNTDDEDSTTDEGEKIDLNSATKEELKKINGIGDVKADNIISYREANGSFQKIDEIKNVSGIGEVTFEKMKEYLIVKP